MIRILEQVLPARFGGSALDYQLQEQEDGGFTRLSLVVSPRVRLQSELAVIELVLAELAGEQGSAGEVAAIWRHADTFRVRRAEPVSSRTGKMMPLHLVRNGSKQ
jgi:hypothetical protein